jgi:hypothetical protein
VGLRWWYSTTDITPLLNQIELRLAAIEGRISVMPTRADLDAAKQALSAEIANVINHINQLEQQLQQGQPITDQDIQDLKADLATLQGSDQVTPPTPASGQTRTP